MKRFEGDQQRQGDHCHGDLRLLPRGKRHNDRRVEKRKCDDQQDGNSDQPPLQHNSRCDVDDAIHLLL